MCRFLAYLGRPIGMEELLYAPSDSIIRQSYAAREIEEPLNGDGFGVGWYHHDRSPEPALFVSVTPAWNNRNLRYLAPKVRSHCIAAHVRAASVGDVAEANCHPFHSGDRLMMHNGGVEQFDRIKRSLCALLTEERYLWVRGQTDSEHLFALFLDHLHASGPHPSPEQVADAFEAMITDVKKLMAGSGITEPAYLNMVFADGRILVGLRYVSDPAEAPLSLYYSAGKRYSCNGGSCRMVHSADSAEHAAMIVSEKLTDVAGDFVAVPEHHFVLVDASLNVTLRKVRA